MAGETGGPSIDDVIARIHGEIERRRTGPVAAGAPAVDAARPPAARAALRLQPEFTPRPDGRYALHELLDYHDADFVTNAYRALLGRWPDPAGLRHYVELLRRGEASRIDVLGRIRWSREGRRRQVAVRGLLPRFALERALRVPVLGGLLHWGVALVGLPRIVKTQRRFEAYATFRDEALAAALREAGAEGAAHELSLQSLRSSLEHSFQQLHAWFDAERRAREELGGQAWLRLDALSAAVAAERAAREELGGIATSALEQARQALQARIAELVAALGEERSGRERLARALEEERAAREQAARAALEELARMDAALTVQNRSLRELGGEAVRVERDLSAQAGRLERVVGEQMGGLAELTGRLDHQIRGEIAAREALAGSAGVRLERSESVLSHLRHEVVQQARRVDLLLEEARRRLPEPLGEEQLRVFAGEAEHRLDALYVSLEDELRGPPGLIKQRLAPYLALVRGADAGSERWPLLDLGCGRGEWLELLRENGLVARGVDRNPLLVQACREAGLAVEEVDLLEHLRKLPAGSLGAVTGFHIVEHLPLEVLADMLAETARVLRPGGVAIFETPNPANVLVGSHTFYLDPTHRNPLPPLLMRFLLEARGLSRVEVLEVNPSPDVPALPGDDPLTRRFNEYFCGARDYAVVGYRA